jgi:hypothetical protein
LENTINIIAGVIGVYFLFGMMMFFNYLYFKKGSLKKSILHIFISVALLSGLVFVYINQNKFMDSTTPETPGTFTAEMKETLDTKKPHELELNDVGQIAMLSYYKWDKENEAYLDKVKDYYIYYHMNVSKGKTKEELSKEFDQARVAANMAK